MKRFCLWALLFVTTAAYAEQVKVSVPGMVCQLCVQGMKRAFKDAVKDPDKDILVDLEAKMLTLNLATSLSDDAIKSRVKDTGYNAQKIERVASP